MEKWKPHKGAQEAFHRSSAFEVGYGGAAGGGKSESLLREALRQTHIPGYRAILFRRTYPELENSLIDRAIQIYPGMGGESKNSGKVWFFKTENPLKPSKIIFGHLEHEHTVHNYQSAEFDVIGFDEATSFTEYQVSYMRSRVRGTNKKIRKYIMYATNPGNIGHVWFKTRFIEGRESFRTYYFKLAGDKEVQCLEDDPDALSRVFIPAKVWDNPTLIENDPQYIARLKSMDETNRRMLLEGDWDVFQGQYFGDWRRETHVTDPFTIPAHWKRFIGIDYGFTAPFCALWIAIDEDGNAFVYDEYYVEGKTARENSQAVFEKNNKEPYMYCSVDPSVFAKTHIGETIGETISAPYMDGRRIRLVPASNRRIDGWNTVREYLSPKKDREVEGKMVRDLRPNLRIFSTCVNLIRTLPQMIHDTKSGNLEDMDTTMEDHAVDALRYVLHTLRTRKSKKPESRIKRKIRELTSSKKFNPNKFYVRS